MSNTRPDHDTPAEVPYLREIPRPTPWPMIAAFGVTFLFAGIVTNPTSRLFSSTIFKMSDVLPVPMTISTSGSFCRSALRTRGSR